MFFCCTKTDNPKLNVNTEHVTGRVRSNLISSYPVITLDAFIFEDSGKLDCYQRIIHPNSLCDIASGSGYKQVLLVANSQNDKYDWANIRNISTMTDTFIELEEERRETPVMTSLFKIEAGGQTDVELCPVRCEIMINSLRCDFSSEAYHDEGLTEVKIYLTYVNASYSLLSDESNAPLRIINPGMLDTNHMTRFAQQDMIAICIDEIVKSKEAVIQKSLYCYANQPEEESIGSPMTKLVIEGKIGGNTYYYPIRINPEGGGIAKGNRYIFDIVLTRTGVTDPDGDLTEQDIDIKMEIEKWKEKDGYEVRF